MALLTGPQRAFLYVEETGEAIEFDASVQEGHTSSAEITQHPVEEGVDITDHIRALPDDLSVNVIVSNNPPIVLASLRAEPVTGFSDPASRAEDACTFLRGIIKSNQTVGFSTTLREYTNMAIATMSVDRDATTGNIANINMSLREIKVATTETVAAPEPVAKGRRRKNKQGKKAKSSPAPATAEKSTSLLTDIFSAFGG